MLELFAEADAVRAEMRTAYERIAEARRRWAREKSAAKSAAMASAEEDGQRLHQKFSALVRAMEIASGLDPEQLAALDVDQGGSAIVIDRSDLAGQKVEPTLQVEDDLANSLDRVRQLLPRGWLDSEPAARARLEILAKPGAFLSLTKNLRRESEAPFMHRFRQAIFVADDLLNDRLGYDHFAGAALVPAIVQLGRKLPLINELRSEGNNRVRRLWAGPSNEVDSVVFELLVAAGCVERGRSVEFIREGAEKTADIRAHKPFPVLIECKRQAGITGYELDEESVVRDIFIQLRAECRRRTVCGTFDLLLTRECVTLDQHEVVEAALAAIYTGKATYLWGSVKFRELPSVVTLSAPTRIFSPRMLEDTFAWNSDLPTSDGICAGFENNNEFVVAEIYGAIGVTWINVSEQAVRKRTWAPTSLLNQAVEQITPGEWGLIYLAYQEGARTDIADARLNAFRERLIDWSHRGDIRVPLISLVRLYPRALGDGQPDLIENVVQLLSKPYGERALVDYFPSTVFTKAR